MFTKLRFSFRPYHLSPCQSIFCVASVLLFLKSICMWLSLAAAPSSAFLPFHKVTLIYLCHMVCPYFLKRISHPKSE